MTDRHFRLFFGIVLLALLYLDEIQGIGFLVAFLLFEGVTNWRFPLIARRVRGDNDDTASVHTLTLSAPAKIPFDAERALRLVMALILILSVYLFPESVWWMAWFVGFAVLGAGVSGVCPMLTSLRMLGFR